MTDRRAVATTVLALAGLAGVLALGVLRAQSPPQGPVEPPWDRVRCTRCRMLVGEPSYAGQLQTASGDLLFFDDPGCLLLFAEEHESDVRAAYLHHAREARWVPLTDAVFAPMQPTPMGYGLGALDAGSMGGFGRDRALEIAREREADRELATR